MPGPKMGKAHTEALPRTDRIRRRSAFRRIQGKGQRTHTKHFLVVQGPGETDHARIGITVTKKIGNAPARNRVKRLVREAFRQNRDLFLPGVDVVFIAKRGAPLLALSDVVAELKRAHKALQRAGKKAQTQSAGLRERKVEAR